MNIVTEINNWRDIRASLQNKKIGFVHTMGNLHAGHISLIQRSQQENEITVAAIFVNPKQFNQVQDYQLYPRTLEQDKTLLQEHQVNHLLLFTDTDLFADQYHIQVAEMDISKELEGEHRPGHFTGMLTIVLKFLNLVQPTRAYYGEKDFQQLLLIQKMARALFLSTDIVGCPTFRDENGLAYSSRHTRLTFKEREHALHFPRLLQASMPIAQIRQELEELHFRVDYIVEKWQRRLAAVWLSDVRLIDNFCLNLLD